MHRSIKIIILTTVASNLMGSGHLTRDEIFRIASENTVASLEQWKNNPNNSNKNSNSANESSDSSEDDDSSDTTYLTPFLVFTDTNDGHNNKLNFLHETWMQSNSSSDQHDISRIKTQCPQILYIILDHYNGSLLFDLRGVNKAWCQIVCHGVRGKFNICGLLTEENKRRIGWLSRGPSSFSKQITITSKLITHDNSEDMVTALIASLELLRHSTVETTLSLETVFNTLQHDERNTILKKVIGSLQGNNSLCHFKFSYNCLGVDSIKVLLDALKMNTNLQSLNLRSVDGKDSMMYVTPILSNCRSLKVFDFSENHIGDNLQILIAQLNKNCYLTDLSLDNNDITCNGLASIASWLCSNSTLSVLSLQQNKITANGAEILAKGLESNRTLTKLDLNMNFIGDEGAQKIANLLTANTSLNHLNVTRNRITDVGTQYLVDMLAINRTLIRLDFYNNVQCTQKSIDAFTAILGKNKSIRYIDADGIVDYDATSELYALLEARRNSAH